MWKKFCMRTNRQRRDDAATSLPRKYRVLHNTTAQEHVIKFLKMWISLSVVLIYEYRLHRQGRPQNTTARHTGSAQWRVILDKTNVGCYHTVLTWFQQRFIVLLLTTWSAETRTHESSILQITVLNSQLSLLLFQQIWGTKLTRNKKF